MLFLFVVLGSLTTRQRLVMSVLLSMVVLTAGQIVTNRNCRNGVIDCIDARYLCYTPMCLSEEDDMDPNNRHCEYLPIECSDGNPCTINDRCESTTGLCMADPNPECAIPSCLECCASKPYTFSEQILVTNRGDGTLTSIYAASETVKTTIPLEGAHNQPMYMDAERGTILMVGDRSTSSVRYLDPRTYEQYAEIPTCNGVNHMDSSDAQNQTWVTCDLDRGFSVVSVNPPASIRTLVPVPADLIANFTAHDVAVGVGFAIGALRLTTGGSPTGWLIRYSTTTFLETARRRISGDANLYYNGVDGSPLYVADEGGFLLIINTSTLAVLANTTVPGVHNIMEHNKILYVTNASSSVGTGSLFAYNVNATSFVPLSGSPYTLPFRNPHNIVTNSNRTKIFITHTRDSKVSVCNLTSTGIVQQPCRAVNMTGGLYDVQPSSAPDEVPYNDEYELVGFAGPLGILRNVPACTCDTACWDNDECTIDACHLVFSASNVLDIDEQCFNYDIPGCEDDPYHVFCPDHQVNLTVVDNTIFELTPFCNGTTLQFCYSSTYMGNNTALVLGFDEYDECALNLRGTCDNRPAIHDTIPSYCAYAADVNILSLCFDNALPEIAFSIPGISTLLSWANIVDHTPTFIYDPVLGTGHVQGELQDPLGLLVLHVDLVFSGANSPPVTPYKPMLFSCYSGATSSSTWVYFPYASGRIYAKPGTLYTGLYIDITGVATRTQFGKAASGRNLGLGMYGAYTWNVLSQPLNGTLNVTLTPPGSIKLFLDLDTNCFTPLDYCTLFGEPQVPPANNWTATLTGGDLRYCRNFTIGQLSSCRAYSDTHTPLLDYTLMNTTNIYQGRFYATLVRPENCHNHVTAYYGDCGEATLSSFAFDFTISINAGGVVSSSYIAADLGFDAYWLENIWLPSGDLKVCFETRIRHVDRDPLLMPETTLLVNPAVVVGEETGYPMIFTASSAACEPDRDPEFCFQRWCLTSQNATANNITDLSGLKPVTFDVEIKGHVLAWVRVNFNITALVIGDNQHVHGEIGASLALFRDAHFTVPYFGNTGNWLVDCSWLYGELTLDDCDVSFAVAILSAYICWSPTGDMLPYDSNNPTTTGCASRVDAVQYLVYTNDPFEELDDPVMHHFTIIPTPSEPSKVRFAWKIYALTSHKQIIQLRWQAYDLDGALIESMADVSLDINGQGEYEPPDGEHGERYLVKCAEGHHCDPDTHLCVPDHDHNHHHHHDDDDDDEDGVTVVINNYENKEEGFTVPNLVGLVLVAIVCFFLLWYVFLRRKHRHRHHHRHHHKKHKSSSTTTVVYDDQDFSLSLRSD